MGDIEYKQIDEPKSSLRDRALVPQIPTSPSVARKLRSVSSLGVRGDGAADADRRGAGVLRAIHGALSFNRSARRGVGRCGDRRLVGPRLLPPRANAA